MREELRKYSSIGNKKGILLLCKKVLTGQMEDLSSIGKSCMFVDGVDLNFNCGIMAFEEIKLIAIDNNKCISQGLIYSEHDEDSFINAFCGYCLKSLIEMDLIKIEHLKFNESKDVIQIPRYAFKMECSVYRNMLIILGALIPEGPLYTLNKVFESDFSNQISKKHKFSQEYLLDMLERERIIGEEGEAFVLAFERRRCPFSAKQQQKIKQISIVDASAGFDILSLENEKSDAKRYIEVKTYSGKVHFFWSANEIDNAKLRGASYFLYLVDYDKIKNINYEPLMIANPYYTIKDLPIWDMSPASFSIKTKCSENELKSLLHTNH